MSRPHQPRGFTIVEMLIVVALVLVLASLLFPLVSSVTAIARSDACAANERQIVGAMLAYAQANGGYLPATTSAWSGGDGIADFDIATPLPDLSNYPYNGVLWPYLAPSSLERAAVMHCPMDSLEQLCTYGGVDVPQPPYRNFSYSINYNINNQAWFANPQRWPQAEVGMPVRWVQNPSKHVLLYEEFAPNDSSNYGPGDLDDWLTGRHGSRGTTEHRASYGDQAWRNDGRGNVGYFDGHVSSMTVEEYFNSPPYLGFVNYHFGPLNQ